ncbi:Oxidation resistance protein 1 [Yarrowia sp. B02]|nr:Oxidation resistance protein 1 [Yarrowia sp. B02]
MDSSDRPSLRQRLSNWGRTDSKPDAKDPPLDPSAIMELPPLPPVELLGYSHSTRTRIMTSELADEIRNLVPERIKLYRSWQLMYSLEQNGASLTTLYHRNVPPHGDTSRNGFVLAVKNSRGQVFGAYTDQHYHVGGKKFYGNGDCFLWKVKNADSFQAFPYTGENNFVVYCNPHFLSLGGGDGKYGLWLDDALKTGVTYPCATFGNESLGDEKFDVVAVEVWRIGE